jgi:uncharacterized protein (DUF2141 family)
MARPSNALHIVIVLVVVALSGVRGDAQSPTTFVVSGSIRGASGAHTIHVAVWNAEGFLTTPVQETAFVAARDVMYAFRVPAGRWAISAFEDLNENGVLDRGVFGPKEPTGFVVPFRSHRRPRFVDVAMEIDHDIGGADIVLGH